MNLRTWKLMLTAWYIALFFNLPSLASAEPIIPNFAYYFGHGLWKYSAYYQQECFKGFFKEGIQVFSANGPDFLDASVAEATELDIISKLPFWEKIKMRLYRDFIRIRALRKASMGQDDDQAIVLKTLEEAGYPTNDVIYIGHSKGGGLGANLLQKYQWKGAILICPFCNANVAFRDFPPVSSLPRITIIDNYIVPFLRRLLFVNYKENGQQPLDFYNSATNKCPVLIISVRGDTVVPQYHQQQLYNVLKKCGWDVYYHEIEVGKHGRLAQGIGEHHDKLIAVVQAFQEYVLHGTKSDLLQSPDRV